MAPREGVRVGRVEYGGGAGDAWPLAEAQRCKRRKAEVQAYLPQREAQCRGVKGFVSSRVGLAPAPVCGRPRVDQPERQHREQSHEVLHADAQHGGCALHGRRGRGGGAELGAELGCRGRSVQGADLR